MPPMMCGGGGGGGNDGGGGLLMVECSFDLNFGCWCWCVAAVREVFVVLDPKGFRIFGSKRFSYLWIQKVFVSLAGANSPAKTLRLSSLYLAATLPPPSQVLPTAHAARTVR
jgi:hypothetical protein